MRIGRVPGLGAATSLAVVTLAVFATFQNYGPESAVRRFQHAVATNDMKELDAVSASPSNATATRDLVRIVASALATSGANYRIVNSERTPSQVEMLAFYNGRPIVWVVVKSNDRWRIDPYLTLQGLRKLGYQ